MMLMLALTPLAVHYLTMESTSSGGETESNQNLIEKTPEELLLELKVKEIWLSIHESGFAAERKSIELRINRYITDFARVNEIRQTLGMPPREMPR